MDVDEIRKQWTSRRTNKQASVDLWNSMAGGFGEFELPGFHDDSFLKLLDNHGMLDPAGSVLDVGCGAGKYAFAIAGRCRRVVATDLASQMIEIAQRRQAELGIENVDLVCADWHQLDLDRAGYRHQFDLVMAHLTPAVGDAETFEKLSAASTGWCVLSKPIRRTDPVSDAVKALVGITERRESSDTDLLYAFELLWRQGYLPRLDYERQSWKLRKTLDEACGLYLNRIRTYRDISAAEEDRIRAYLGSLLNDGFVREDIETTVATLFWRVDRPAA
ncbi:MAG: class I SAM-dependent methyltransferase [Dactylosporangium sp.]|nr:class I SAM-dependent methyltransferase [Dactylosporangium sp.]NNJ62029.1 class I SAM-dependent methyltransferase [Dactylosporangium sp.]